MDQNSPYFKQVQLLVQALPVVAEQPCFALKGGTAINLFLHNLPRLSVDIDLTYLPIKDRDASLADIQQALLNIKQRLEQQTYRVTANRPDNITRLLVENSEVRIKIELSPVLRGTVHPATTKRINAEAETLFGFAELQVLDENDLYAGKICAALDRQHPRDLFDCQWLLANEGISETLKNTFLVYLMSHPRPMAELLDPVLQSLDEAYEKEFKHMTAQAVSLESLEATRNQLITELHAALNTDDKEFLVSLKQGHIDWQNFSYPEVQHLPAIKWKVHNLQQMDAVKRQRATEKLQQVLEK